MNTKITNYNETVKNLAAWIEDLKEAARDDDCFSVAYFEAAPAYPFTIVGGWRKGFERFSDIFCTSKSHPDYAMCVNIVVNDPECEDFEKFELPVDKHGEVEDLCVALEHDDNSEAFAVFLLGEWERIMEEHGEAIGCIRWN